MMHFSNALKPVKRSQPLKRQSKMTSEGMRLLKTSKFTNKMNCFGSQSIELKKKKMLLQRSGYNAGLTTPNLRRESKLNS